MRGGGPTTPPSLFGQTVVVIGGSAGIGLEASIADFDATDFDGLGRFFDELPTPIDHPPRDPGGYRR